MARIVIVFIFGFIIAFLVVIPFDLFILKPRFFDGAEGINAVVLEVDRGCPR